MTNLETYMVLNDTLVDDKVLPILIDEHQLNHAIDLFNGFNFNRTTLEQWCCIGAICHYFKANKNNKAVVGEELNWIDHIELTFKGINEHQRSKSITLYVEQEQVFKWYEAQETVTAQNIRTVIDAYKKDTAVPTSQREQKQKDKKKQKADDEKAVNSLVQRFKQITDELIKFKSDLDESELELIDTYYKSTDI